MRNSTVSDEGQQHEYISGQPYFSTYPANTLSLPLHRQLAMAYKLQGDFNTAWNIKFMRFITEVGTRFMSPKFRSSSVNSRYIQINGKHGKIGLRIFAPGVPGPLPVVMYMHGGGWTLGSSAGYTRIGKNLSHFAKAVVVSVDYHLSPEFKFPVPFEDCLTALQWVSENASTLGGDARRISVAGDSAGGNLSAALSLYCRDNGGPSIYRQILINPAVDASCNTSTFEQYRRGYGLCTKTTKFFWNNYLSTLEEGDKPYVSPLRATDLSALPPAFVITSEYDVLREEGEQYAHALFKAGTPVKLIRYAGMGHTMLVFGSVKETARHAYEMIANEVNS